MRLAIVSLLLTAAAAHAEDIVFPADSGVLDVKAFGAKGDGVADDTAAIQAALAKGLDRHVIVYLPNGTYRVSDTLAWRSAGKLARKDNGGWGRFLSVQGQSRARTIIRLVDAAPGFTDAAKPKPVVMTASGDDAGKYDDANGEGNQAFEDHLWNLTIDVGAGNPGAVGVDYQVSNWGALRDVTISAKPGSGLVGISCARRDNGPGLLQRVSVQGFRRALAVDGWICHLTIEHLDLKGQEEVGVDNHDATLAIHDLVSANAVTALRNRGDGFVVLLDATLRGGAKGQAAVENVDGASRMVARGVTAAGYASAVRNRGTVVAGLQQASWTADPPTGAGVVPEFTVRDAPASPSPAPGEWVGAGPGTDQDDTVALQAALDAGKPVVYLRAGTYRATRTLNVPPTVRRIVGMGVSFGTTGDGLKDQPLFRFAGGTAADTTVLERFQLYAPWTIAHDGPRTLVVRDLRLDAYRAGPGAGALFVDNASGGPWHLVAGQQVWGRQWNVECQPPCIVNHGAHVWCLGFKTETGETMIENSDGGVAAFWGGFCYTFGGIPKDRPAFTNTDGTLVLSFAGASFVPDGGFHTWVRDRQGAVTSDLTRDQAQGRGISSSVTLYAGGKP